MKFAPCPPPPLIYPDMRLIKEAVNVLTAAKKPLVIVGKGELARFLDYSRIVLAFLLFLYNFSYLSVYAGAAYGRAEAAVRELIYSMDAPFLPTPMGKGVVPDTDEHCVSSARTTALLQSDVVLLLGARLNWMLHFGRPPRFHKAVKVIQVNRYPLETRYEACRGS